MSVNQRGRIVGQIVHPRVAASDRKEKRLPTARPRLPTPAAQDIIEISSDEDEDLQPPPKRALTKRGHQTSTYESDYKARLSQKDHEIEKLKKREKELERAIATQKKEMDTKSQLIPKVDEVEEELTCEICAMRMWSPYRLTECGHVFCLGCLLDWFDSIHVQFLESHPEYTPPSSYLKEVLRRPFDFPQDFYRVCMHMPLGPKYTCPSCRTVTTRRPVEDFKVKALVSWLGSVQGIKPPESRIPPGTGDTVFNGYSLL